MKNKDKKALLSVTVIIPMRNASTTVLEALKSITQQTYPIEKIIVVDNVSKDNSCEIVAQFAKKSKIPITLFRRKKDLAIASSYNLGARNTKSDLIVFLTSDASLPSNRALERLLKPLREDEAVVATYPSTILPRSLWDKYNFWQKFHSCRDVDVDNSTFAVKFDCVRRKIFFEIGGFDEINFGGDDAIGGEDVDIMIRLKEKGKVVKSKAVAYHLHYMGGNYNILNMMRSQKMSARSYGRFLRKSTFKAPYTAFLFSIRPGLAVLPFIPQLTIIGIILIIFYAFYYTRTMFIMRATRTDPRTILVPFINIFFLYYNFVWLLQAFFTYKKNS